MIGIKKVQVTPIDLNIGKIIDSATTTDDKTKNTYSARVIDAKETALNTSISTINTSISTLSTEVDSKQPLILSGTTEPSSSLGNDGDVYFQYSE